MSELINQFDANYTSGVGLNDSIIDLIETSRTETPEVRQVSDESVFAVAERALTASALLPMDVQHFNVIREVTNFLTLASNGAISDTVSKHSDLLPTNHPDSTATHEFSASELRQIRAEWIAADPRIEDANARAIVAAVYGSNPNSLDFYYNLIRLNSLADQIPSDLRITPLVAFGDPYAGKNSFWHRKMRAEAQRRDDEGQFAEMGGGARVYVRMPMGNIISVVGKIAGIPENDPNGIDIEITDVPGITPGIYTVPANMAKFYKAILPEEAVKRSSPVGPGLNVKYIDIADMIRKDLPTSWFESESGTTVPSLTNAVRATKNYATGDGYRVSMYDGPSEALQKRVNEARDKFGSLVVNTMGTDSLENDKPVYELISTKRGQEEVVGYAQDWAAVQAMATKEDENYPDAENEPITETKEPAAQLPEAQPEPEPEAVEAPEGDVVEDSEDMIENPGIDPLKSIPNSWTPVDSGRTFVSSDGVYSVTYGAAGIGTDMEQVLDIENGNRSSAEAPVFVSDVFSIYDNVDGKYIGVAFDWNGVQKYIDVYERDEESVAVDRRTRTSNIKATKSQVVLDDLIPERYDLLRPMDSKILDKIKKEELSKVFDNPTVGGLDAKLGAQGVDEGELFPHIKDLFVYKALWKDLLYRKQVPEAVDMFDEMTDYPENFSVRDLVTLYHNLNNLYEDKADKNVFLPYTPQQREKTRRAIKNLSTFEVPTDKYSHLKENIENYRFVPFRNAEANNFLADLNDILNQYRDTDLSQAGLTFKDQKEILGKDLIKTDAILDSDGTILEITSIAEDEDNPDMLDVYVKRGDKQAYYPVGKEDKIIVYRGSGELPTPENIKIDQKMKRGVSKAQAKNENIEDILEESSDEVFNPNDPAVIAGRLPEGVQDKFTLNESGVRLFQTLRSRRVIKSPLLYYILSDIISNPEKYNFGSVKKYIAYVNENYEERPQGELSITPEQLEFIRTMIRDRDVPEEERIATLKYAHTYSMQKANERIQELKQYRARPKSAEDSSPETEDPLSDYDISARGIVRQRKEITLREEDFIVDDWNGNRVILTTSLTGADAPNEETIAAVAQTINNFHIDPDNPATLKFFMGSHRTLPKKFWKQLIETWRKPVYAKHGRPAMFADAMFDDPKNSPTNRQLSSVARLIDKGALPDYFVDWIMSEYKGKNRTWFAKIIDVTKEIENNYDKDVLEAAMRGGKDLTDLRVPDNYKVPDSYVPLEPGIGIDPADVVKYKTKAINAFPAFMLKKYKADEFWAPVLDVILPKEGVVEEPEENLEDQIAKTLARAARLSDAKKTRRRISRVVAELAEALNLSNRELSMGGKRFVQQAIEELEYLRGTLDHRRKNIIQDSPAELDRRLKLIATALADTPAPFSYGRLRNPSEATLNKLGELSSLVATLVGTYKAGESPDENEVAVDRKRIYDSSIPSMKRFTPPAFDGPVFEALSDVNDWKEVKEFIANLALYVFDFETTGLFNINDPDIKNDPVQLAIAKAVNFSIEQMYNSYINPDSKISGFTLQTIGDGTGKKVTKQFLAAQKSKLEAMKDFLEMVPEGAVLVGHNGLLFDMEVLNRTLREAGLPEYNFGGFIDTYGLSYHVMPRWTPENPDAPFKLSKSNFNGEYGSQAPSDTLESLVTYFGLSNNGRHEADADTISTLEILEKILDYAIDGKSDKGRSFDFYGSKNGWSKEEYLDALNKYKKDSAAYIMSRMAFNFAMAMQNVSDRISEAGQTGVSNDVLNKLLEIANRPIVGLDDDRTPDLPAARVVSELPASSYVIDNGTGRVGRSYGSTGQGLVLVEFAAADYLISARKILEKIAPNNLYNATESLITKDGSVLDYGMTVSHPMLSEKSGVFVGFENINVGLVKSGTELYRVPVKELSILKYEGATPATLEQINRALDLLNDLETSKAMSRTFARAIKKTIDSGSYPQNAMSDLIAMLVNSKDQLNIVQANKDVTGALPNSQSSASSTVSDPAVDRRRVPNKRIITEKDVENVEIDTTLIKKNMPKLQLNDEVLTILKAVAAVADPKHKGKSLNKKHYNMVIRAYAGTGKTTTMEAITNLIAAMRPEEYIMYLVFGKENQEEADQRFNTGNAIARTLHSLALGVEANAKMREKFNNQSELVGANEPLNILYGAERVAATFGIYEMYYSLLAERYGENAATIPPQYLVQYAYNGLENWVMSAERNILPEHFVQLRAALLDQPEWGPPGPKVDWESIEPGEKLQHPDFYNIKFMGFKTERGSRVAVFENIGPKGGVTEIKIKDVDFEDKKDKFTMPLDPWHDFGDYFIPELTEIAQMFWSDLQAPLDRDTPQLLVDFQHMVKNWSLGNVDLTATKKDYKGKTVSAIGLDRIPSVILLDEGQDMNPIFVDIVRRQSNQYDNGIQIITVGDSYQAIFGFSGNVDALQEVPADGSFPLSVSYRSAAEILPPANTMLEMLDAPDRLKTASKEKGNIVKPNSLMLDNMWIITRSNAGILDAAFEMASTDFFKGKSFAVTPNFKSRILSHIVTLQYLKTLSIYEAAIKKAKDLIATGGLNEIELAEQEQKIKEYTEKRRTMKPPANRPQVLIGATWQSLKDAQRNNELGEKDTTTSIIFKLMGKIKEYDSKSEQLVKASDTTALKELKKEVSRYRIFNKYVEMPEEIGKAGSFGNGIAYVVKNGKLILSEGGSRPRNNPNYVGLGLKSYRVILEEMGFTQSEEIDETKGKNYRKWEWERSLRKTDQDYIDDQIKEVYAALSGRDANLTIMTGHTAKGLENPAVRLWKDFKPGYVPGAGSQSDEDVPPKTIEQVDLEHKKLMEALRDPQEQHLWYTSLTRAKILLDMGGLAEVFATQEFKSMLNRKPIPPKKPKKGDDSGPAVDKRVLKGFGDYYDKENQQKLDRAESYLSELRKAMSTPKMQRTIPFRYADDSSVGFEISQTEKRIQHILDNPGEGKNRDLQNRLGLLEILSLIESGGSIANLSEYDRQRLFAYLGSSSLGASESLIDDPTEKIRSAIAELNRRLGIE